MAKRQHSTVKIEDLGEKLQQTLTLYHEDVNEAINAASDEAVKSLAKKTKATAPEGGRHGQFKRNISSKLLKKNRNGNTYVWYVKAPDHRLTHLLVKGHATRDGGRTKANPFLHNAWAEVQPEYLEKIKEALQSGK